MTLLTSYKHARRALGAHATRHKMQRNRPLGSLPMTVALHGALSPHATLPYSCASQSKHQGRQADPDAADEGLSEVYVQPQQLKR